MLALLTVSILGTGIKSVHAPQVPVLVNQTSCGTAIPGSWNNETSTCILNTSYQVFFDLTVEIPDGVTLAGGGLRGLAGVTVDPGGVVQVDSGGSFIMDGSTNNGTINDNGGTLSVLGTPFENAGEGIITISTGGVLTMTEDVISEVGGVINVYGELSNEAELSNSGNLVFECGSTYNSDNGAITGNGPIDVGCASTVTSTVTSPTIVTTTVTTSITTASTSISTSVTTLTQTPPTVTVTVTGTTTETTTKTETAISTQTSTATSTQTTTTTSTAQSPSLTVSSENQHGQAITGFYTVLRTSLGQSISHGYTPDTFSGLTEGTTYEIELDSYGSCQFSHWSDGVTSDPRTFTASGAQMIVGVYDCGSSAAPAVGHSELDSSPADLAIILGLIASSAVAVTAVRRVR
jgi:hypothetical protein